MLQVPETRHMAQQAGGLIQHPHHCGEFIGLVQSGRVPAQLCSGSFYSLVSGRSRELAWG